MIIVKGGCAGWSWDVASDEEYCGPPERPLSSPRPDIGEVYADGVLLVWKPVESCGPVTYTVQCSVEGELLLCSCPRVGLQGPCAAQGLNHLPGAGGTWNTLASDIFDCCYLTGKLPQGGTYIFRTACVSKAGIGPYSSPSEQVLLGGPCHLGEWPLPNS